MPHVIREFQGEYRFLSNFWPAEITFGEWVFPTAEHAYQAAKSLDPEDWLAIRSAGTPGIAKKRGKSIKIRPDWEDVKLEAMTEIVGLKFQIPELREKLLATGNALLREGNTWGDTFWGISNGKGENHLGRILMNVRFEIMTEQDEETADARKREELLALIHGVRTLPHERLAAQTELLAMDQDAQVKE